MRGSILKALLALLCLFDTLSSDIPIVFLLFLRQVWRKRFYFTRFKEKYLLPDNPILESYESFVLVPIYTALPDLVQIFVEQLLFFVCLDELRVKQVRNPMKIIPMGNPFTL